jgi:hypothetical protein
MRRTYKDETNENVIKNGVPICSSKNTSTLCIGLRKPTSNPKLCEEEDPESARKRGTRVGDVLLHQEGRNRSGERSRVMAMRVVRACLLCRDEEESGISKKHARGWDIYHGRRSNGRA